MNKRVLIAFLAVLMYCTTFAQTWTVPEWYNPTGTRNSYRAIHVGETLTTPAGGQPSIGTKGSQGAGALFTDSVSQAFYYYVNGQWRNLGEANCNGFLIIPQVIYQGRPFHFSISGSRYNIDCFRYNKDTATLVVNAGDTLGRYDVFYADTTGYHVKEGEPNETPNVPTLLAGQLYITSVFIPAFDSLGTGIDEIIVYNENIESTINNSGIVSVVGNSTATPYTGTYQTRITTINNGDYWEYQIPSGSWDVSNAQLFSFFIRNRALGMPQLANLRVSLWNGTTQVSQFEPTIGFDRNSLTYQGGSISLGAFGTLTNTHVTKVRFRYTSNNATTFTGYDFDYIHFINGIGQPTSSGGVSSVDISVAGNALTATGPNTGSVSKSFSWLGNSGQYIDGQGILRSYNALTTIGTFNSLTSDARGANISSNTIAFQPVTSSNPGMATSIMKASWDSASARAVTNLGGYDSLAVYVDALTTGFMSLKDSTGIGIAVRNGYLAIYNTATGSTATGSEGLSASSGDVRLGGTVASPASLASNRNILANRHALIFGQRDAGAALWQFSDSAYSPYQFLTVDTIASNDAALSYNVPLSGIFARRTMYFNSGIYQQTKQYGHSLSLIYSFQDSVKARTDGGDYGGNVIEVRIKPRNSGYSAFRTGHGTGDNTRLFQGMPSLVVNMYADGKDGASTDTLHVNGNLIGVSPYLVAALGSGKINIDNVTYVQPGSFINSNTHIKRQIIYGSAATYTAALIDSSFLMYDTSSQARVHWRGNAVFGYGSTWSSSDKLRVYGNVNMSDSLIVGTQTQVSDTTGYDVVMRRRSDGSYIRIRADQLGVGGGGGGVTSFGSPGSGTANGGAVSGSVATLHYATGTTPGMISATTQSMSGNKTFNDIVTIGDELRAQNGIRLRDGSTSNYTYLIPNTATSVKHLYFADDDVDGDTIATRRMVRSIGGGGGSSTFVGLSDGPGAFSGNALKAVRVNAGSTALEYFTLGAGTGDALVANPLSQFASTTSAQLAGVMSNETGTNKLVYSDAPAMASITLAAGTASAGTAPLYFTSGTELTSPVSGVVNFDGTRFSSTTASGRGITPSTMFARIDGSDFTMSNVNTVQPVFPTTADVWTLQASTTYYFEGVYYLTHGATSHSLGLSFELAGGASVTSVSYSTTAWVTAAGTNTASQTTNLIQAATNTAVNAAGANAQEVVYFSGHISMNAGGTVTPSITFSSAPGGSPVAKVGSYIRFTPVGSNTVTSIGNVQ